jgi:hypothetical protein
MCRPDFSSGTQLGPAFCFEKYPQLRRPRPLCLFAGLKFVVARVYQVVCIGLCDLCVLFAAIFTG